MRFLLLLLFALTTTSLFAQTQMRTQIVDVDLGSGNDEPLIFLSSGHVVRFSKNSKLTLNILREAVRTKKWFELEINKDRELVSMIEAAAPIAPVVMNEKLFSPKDVDYQPSILKDIQEARKYFYNARIDHKNESQCYNRAHVWTYEWRTKNNFYANKVWLFFTRKFIRKYKFEWWFHVSPMVHVIVDGEVKERVMDVKYAKARGPITLKQWTDTFMRDNADCPVVEKYTDQADYPESGSCFVMKSSMYYYQPVDLEMRDTVGTVKTMWLEPEVRHAYDEAFGVELGAQQ